MADFRQEIHRLQDRYKTSGLINALAERLGERPTSVNPLTEAMFAELRPETQPVAYARRSEDYTPETSRVATNAIALKILLHEQVGRPLYEPVERLVKQDWAECLVAVDAFHDGVEQGMGLHTPTTLPLEVDGFVEEPPDRSRTPESPFGTIAPLESKSGLQEVEARFDSQISSYFVYVLDCTPSIDDEPTKIWDRRRAVQTKREAEISLPELEPKERATHALNQNHRVYYVGSTNDVPKRVREHMSGTDKSGVNFTNTLPPRALVKVQPCDSRDHAESLEGELARQLTAKESCFAYSDEM